jgi:hypothetical protein
MPDETESERLRRQQGKLADQERDLAEHSADEDERTIHERRSDKASYLEEKLEQRKRTERSTDD